MSYHFSKGSVDDQIINDLKTLDRFEDSAFEELLDIVMAFLTAPKDGDKFMNQVEEFASGHGVSVGALKNVMKSLLRFFKTSLKRNLTPMQIKEDFERIGLSSEKTPLVEAKWKANLIALSRSVVGQTFMVNQLVDMEWKFGVTASSSDMKVVGQTFLQLKLVIDRGSHNEDVFMEMTLPQFYSFLHEMERAKSTLEYFS